MFSFKLQSIGLLVASWFIWRLFRRTTSKSPLDNIPGPASQSWLMGNFSKVFHVKAWDFHRDIGEKYGGVIRIVSAFGQRQIYTFDPKALHHIVVKDQHIYEETSGFILGNKLVFGPGLLATLGDHHRKQRKMLNPVFSINHMRSMVPTFYEITHRLRSTILSKVQDGPKEIDMLHWMSRTALELIGQSGLGSSFDSLIEDAPAHPYHIAAKSLVPTTFRLVFFRLLLLPYIANLGSPAFRRFLVNWAPWEALHRTRDIVDVMHSTAVDIFEEKKRALAAGDEAVSKQFGRGKDIMSILMRANMEASEEDRLSDEEVLGQISSFTFAGMDTTSSALSRILHLLSSHPDVQERLRSEIKEARGRNGDLEYDELISLPYLDAVCRETLRLYPPISMVNRTARKDMILPLANPIIGVDGRELQEVVVPKDTNIIVSIIGANRNPDVWGPDATEWKPERWMQSLPNTVSDAHMPGIYSHLMTFLGGSRACIGFKFSQLEMKVVLSVLLESFRFEPSKDIEWLMTGIATPTVKGEENEISQLPLKVTSILHENKIANA